MGTPGAGRQVGLVAVAFAATLLILLGLTTIIRGAPGGPAGGAVDPPPPTDVTVAGPPGDPTPGPSVSIPTRAPAADPVFVGAGDIGDCDSKEDEATAALLDEIAGTVFTVGDNAYPNGSLKQFQECYGPSWGRHLDRTWPVPGNHDYQTSGLEGYRTYFGDAALGPDGETWYSRDLGTWRIIVLDSNCDKVDCGPDSPQTRWLTRTLATSTARCTLALMHHPRYSSGSEHGNHGSVTPFWEVLYAAGADVVISAHDHDYERFAPQDPHAREDRVRGIREFVVGTGGRHLRDFGKIREHSELRVSSSHGVLALTLRPASYDWRFIATRSGFSDRGTAACH